MRLQFGFVIFWRKDFGTKAAHKMLVKLSPGNTWVNVTSIFGVKAEQHFYQIIFDAFNANSIRQKCTKIWCSVKKLLPETWGKL
jgi:hypothetical protein